MSPRQKSSVEEPQEKQEPIELPSRAALSARLEAQRQELLRAMACVNRARYTLEEHVAKPPFGGASPMSPREHESYRAQVLEALAGAGDALATAYPMLERIAEALGVDAMLQQHAPPEPPPQEPAPARSSAGKR